MLSERVEVVLIKCNVFPSVESEKRLNEKLSLQIVFLRNTVNKVVINSVSSIHDVLTFL